MIPYACSSIIFEPELEKELGEFQEVVEGCRDNELGRIETLRTLHHAFSPDRVSHINHLYRIEAARQDRANAEFMKSTMIPFGLEHFNLQPEDLKHKIRIRGFCREEKYAVVNKTILQSKRGHEAYGLEAETLDEHVQDFSVCPKSPDHGELYFVVDNIWEGPHQEGKGNLFGLISNMKPRIMTKMMERTAKYRQDPIMDFVRSRMVTFVATELPLREAITDEGLRRENLRVLYDACMSYLEINNLMRDAYNEEVRSRILTHMNPQDQEDMDEIMRSTIMPYWLVPRVDENLFPDGQLPQELPSLHRYLAEKVEDAIYTEEGPAVTEIQFQDWIAHRLQNDDTEKGIPNNAFEALTRQVQHANYDRAKLRRIRSELPKSHLAAIEFEEITGMLSRKPDRTLTY